jgi:hypothetical protein
MAIPSIALIPVGVKLNKIYSQLPTNGDGDLTFTRANTANRVNSSGLIENVATGVPRRNHADGGCPSLLLEPQSTNLITYPLSFSNAYWSKTGATVAGGFSAPSVDNPTSAFKLVESSVNERQHIYNVFTTVTGTIYTQSIYVKPNGRLLQITGSTGFLSNYINYDLDNGTLVLTNAATATATIKLLSNGYYRCTYTDEATLDSSDSRFIMSLIKTSTNSRLPLYTGDGTSGVYIFGAQLEALPYATSLMLPATEGSTVTRVAESASKTGLSNYINSQEGVLYGEIKALNNNSNQKAITISGTSDDDRVMIYYTGASNTIGYIVYVNNVTVFSGLTILSNILEFKKIALKWKQNEFSFWVNGVKIDESLSGVTFSAGVLNRLGFNRVGGSWAFYGENKDLRVYKTALTDLELITLTTL